MSLSQHEKHRKRSLEAYLRNSRNARDIYPLPAIVSPNRRMRACNDLGYFLKTYLAASFTKPFSENHNQLINLLEIAIKRGGLQAVAMPRGTGKSTLARGAALWAILNNWRRYIIVISASSSEAKANLDIIKGILLYNDLLLEDFPEVCYPFRRMGGNSLLARGQLFRGSNTGIKWESKRIKFPSIPGSECSGNAISSYGINSSIRGTTETMPDGTIARPDFLLLDDLQKDELAKNPQRVAKMEETVNTTLMGLSSASTTISACMTCTVIDDGDMADRYLNHELYPQWHGLRCQMLTALPERMDLWREYKGLLFEDQQYAQDFYRANKSDMNIGAVVSWPECYDPRESVDALEHAMKKWALNERSFFSEYQNTPLKSESAAVQVSARVIAANVNGYDWLVVPPNTARITAFVDVHDDLLYYCVTAFDHHFTAHVIDYGTFPEQQRKYFEKRESGLETLQIAFGGTVNASLQSGLELTIKTLAGNRYLEHEKDTPRMIDAIFIDAKYKPDIVESAILATGIGNAYPCRGIGVKAQNKPMDQWPQRGNRYYGFHWIEETIPGRKMRSLLSDTNFWKSRIHESFALSPGESGSLSFWGRDKNYHKMIADHCNAETVKMVTANGNTVYEWYVKPTAPDNHLFDCLCGTFVAASTQGIKNDNDE